MFLMYLSTLGTCLFLYVIFRFFPMFANLVLKHSNPLSCIAYFDSSCVICPNYLLYRFHHSHFASSHISSVIPLCMFLDVLIIDGFLLIAILSIASMTSSYFSSISFGTLIHVILTFWVGRLVVLPYMDPKFGPNMSSALETSCLVRLQLGIILPLMCLIKSSALGLPIMSCRERAFLALEYCLMEYLVVKHNGPDLSTYE